RAIVVGSRVVAVMRRTAKAGEFRSNLHRGGLGMKVKLDRRYTSAAVAATRAMGLEVAGVDMLEGSSGPKILEINSSPGLEGIERASGVDVANAIVVYAERFVEKQRKKPKRELDARISGALDKERGVLKMRPAGRARTHAGA